LKVVFVWLELGSHGSPQLKHLILSLSRKSQTVMYTGEEKIVVAPITLVSKSGLPRLGVFLPRVV